jgi:hypothetical protein|tara:strand:+ start:412 stop:717 length:306 start_codon:yes stop_codon:yes gene_type:complete
MEIFDFVDAGYRPYYENAYWAISQCELWEWLHKLELPDGRGFMYYKCPELDQIISKMGEQPIGKTHSGSSYGTTMRVMQFIVHKGIDAFKAEYLSNPNGAR